MNRFISFVIPVYNCGIYLEKCIQSIESIGLSSYEIVLIDDGSTDGSSELCDQMENKFEHVKVFHQKNQGVSAARNNGIRYASGEYIVFLDADDDIEPVMMEELLTAMSSEVDMAMYGMTFDYYHNGKMYRRDSLAYPGTRVMNREEWMKNLVDLYSNNMLSPIWNKVFKRSLILENDIWLNEKMFLYEDLEFSLRYMAHCDSILNYDGCIYHYRQSEDEGNAGRRLKRINSLSAFMEGIELALSKLLVLEESGAKKTMEISLQLYGVLTREKISVSDKNEVKEICSDFKNWFDNHEYDKSVLKDQYLEDVYYGRAGKLIRNREYIKLRHGLAVRYKAMKNKQ